MWKRFRGLTSTWGINPRGLRIPSSLFTTYMLFIQSCQRSLYWNSVTSEWLFRLLPLCVHSVSQNSKTCSPLKDLPGFTQTYSYVYTNFGSFVWICVWIVSLLLVRSLKFQQFYLVYYEMHEFFFVKTSHNKWYFSKYNSYACAGIHMPFAV